MSQQDRRDPLRVTVHPADGMFWAELPELPGCYAAADAVAGIAAAAHRAASLWLGRPAPALTVDYPVTNLPS